MSSVKSKLITVVGPTAVGKTRVGIALAKFFRTEIISADSRQFYKEMNIGTAKPTRAELAEIKHHFIDIKSVEEDFDAGQFEREAMDLIENLFARHDHLILCGGSGMYVKAVCEGFDEMPEIDHGIREEIIKEYEQKGLVWLQRQVQINDPVYYDLVDKSNPQRLMRALELLQFTGRPVSELRKNQRKVRPFQIIKIGLEIDRQELYKRIDHRVDEMINRGLVDEARSLYSKRNLNALQTMGYQELFGFFEGNYDLTEAIRLLKRNTRRYAKRQLTWFKKDEEIKWFDPKEMEPIIDYINAQ